MILGHIKILYLSHLLNIDLIPNLIELIKPLIKNIFK